MALPIWGLYMQKVYADKSLGYSQDEVFSIPDDFDPCEDKLNETDSQGNEPDPDTKSKLDDAFFQ